MATTISGNVISTAYKNLVFTAERDADATKLYFTDNSGNDEEITALSTGFTFNSTLAATGTFTASGSAIFAGACQHTAPITVGIDGTGQDVTFYGDTIGGYMLWDQSEDALILGSDADGTDRRLIFGHSTLKSVIGIDDDQDVFAINTDAAFEAGNDMEIDASGNVTFANGTITGTAGTMILGANSGADRSIVFDHDACETIMGIDDSQASNNGSFVIHTGTAFQATLLDNDVILDASGNFTLGNGALRCASIQYPNTDGSGDNCITIADGGGITLSSTLSMSNNLTFSAASDIVVHNSSSAALDITDGSAAFITIDTATDKINLGKDLYSNSGTYIDGELIAVRPSVTNLADDGSIPITKACANIDANGGARTGIRFAGAGTAGQTLVVNNTGGEALTFHNTEGTALVRGIHADHDTMEANFVGLFVSDGTYWNLIAGGVDTQPDVGLTAS